MQRHLEVSLAGLLHDIGKFSQRANQPGKGLSAEAWALQDYVCPRAAAGYPTHTHVLYTAQFAFEHLEHLPAGMDRERVLRLSVYHHRPTDDEPEQKLIAQADHLSSAMEREDEGAEQSGRETFRRVRLRAITNEVRLGEPPLDKWSVGLEPLTPAAAFPVPEPEEMTDLTPHYAALWEQFVGDWGKNRVTDPLAYVNRAVAIVSRYTWCIPAATNAYPDISLFDHLKTTAAIATSLAMANPTAQQPLLVATGEFGGIQDYLYSLQTGAGGLARRLRARSLAVSLAVENVAEFILRQLGLSLANCILTAGGRFTLLLPNTEATHQAIMAAEQGLAVWAVDKLDCQLHPHLATLAIGRDELHDFGGVLGRLATRLEQNKARPLAAALTSEGQWRAEAFSLAMPVVDEADGLCNSCGRRPGRPTQVRDRQVAICEQCAAQTELGSKVVRSRYATFTARPGELPFGTLELVAREADIPCDAYLALDLDGGSGELPGTPVAARYVARHVPHDPNGGVTEFGDLAEQSTGRKALAYLKADVDNLGLLFSKGLTGEASDRRSISRLTTLSRSLEIFFAGHIQHLAADIGDIYTVYSGGDDLLVVGPWDSVVRFAVRLREDFRRFTCGNDSWTLTAGMAVVSSKSPVLLAAAAADKLLKEGKEHAGKDRFVSFGSALPWDQVPGALTRAEQVLAWIRDGSLRIAQVYRLLGYAHLWQEYQHTGDAQYLRYAPSLAYDIRRNWTDAPPEALEWVRGLSVRDSEEMPQLRFVCEYALYGARSKEEGRDDG